MSYITLNKSAFFHNLDIIAKRTADKDKIALVLKDNAYGHGLLEIATMAKEYGIKRAVVRCEAEALQIQGYFEYILILSPTTLCTYKQDFIYTINSLEAIKNIPNATKVELKIDTGMHRNGVNMAEVDEAIGLIKEKGLELNAIFTHYRSADTMSSEWFWQKKNFEKIKENYPSIKAHSCNSAALFRENNFSEDMVRIGIAAYGCLSLDKGFKDIGLEPVLSLTAQRISSRLLLKGQKIGYNASYEANADMQISTYDIGYADGFARLLSNIFRTPDGYELLGRVSMDNTSYASGVDDLLLFDDANVMAEKVQTIGYEILTSLSPSIKRQII